MCFQRGIIVKQMNNIVTLYTQTMNVHSHNIVSVLKRASTDYAQKTAFTLPPADKAINNPKCTSYSSFWSLVDRYSKCLYDKYNIRPGERILGQVSKSLHNVALYYGALQIGAIYVPVNVDYTAKELEYFINDSDPHIVVLADNNAKMNFTNKQVMGEGQLYKQIWQHQSSSNELAPETTNDDLAILCYTSGTTGRPKGAMITHGNLVSNAKTLVDVWRMNDRDVLLHALPTNHVHGLCVALNTALLSAAQLVFMPKFNTDTVLEWLPKCTVMMGVPTFYTRYGMTEGQMICSNPYKGDRIPGTVGMPLPGVDVRLCAEGTVEFKGPNTCTGYWRNEEKTKESFTEDGYFRAGDYGEWTGPNNSYLRIRGRQSDMIISGGLNVYPKEIEHVLDDHSLVSESAVIGVPHSDFGEAVIAVCVLNNNVDNNNDKDNLSATLISHTQKSLASYKVPKRIFFVPELPRNTMGKVQKNVLREQYNELYTATPKK